MKLLKNLNMTKLIDSASFALLFLAAIIVPLFIDSSVINGFALSKSLIVFGLALVCLFLFAIKIIFSKKITLIRSFLDLPILFFVTIALLSAIFSVFKTSSFLGNNNYFIISFCAILFSALWYFISINSISTVKRWESLVQTIILVGGFTAVVFVLKIIFKIDFWGFFSASIWNTIDATNSAFGVWLVTIFALSAGKIIKRDLHPTWLLIYFFISLVSFVALILLGFSIIWWLLLFALILLLILGITFIHASRVGWLSVLFVFALITSLFLVFGTPKNIAGLVPAEVALSAQSSFAIVKDTLMHGVKNFLLGSGLGTFGIDFSQFHDVKFNNDNLAWPLRFSRPNSSFAALLAEGGVLSALALLIIILLVLGHILARWRHLKKAAIEEPNNNLEVFLIASVWILLTGSMFLVFFSVVLWWLWSIFLSLTVIGIALSGGQPLTGSEFAIEETPQYRLVFSFIMIIVIAIVVITGIYGAWLYSAERYFSAAARSSDYAVAEQDVKSAISQRGSNADYHVGLAQVYLLQASAVSHKDKPDLQKIGELLGKAVVESRYATALAPRSVAIWENLVVMYENAALLVPGARDYAINSLQEARKLEPTNPLLAWRLGNNYAAAANWSEAAKQFQEAINLKNNYAAAYASLSAVYEQQNNLDKAIETYQTILPAAQNNPDILFNMGRLLYNRNKKDDVDNAEKLWQQVLTVQPNYSNALYSLGLLNEKRGDKSAALEYYYKVKELNPDNKDVIAKINSLVGGPVLLPSAKTP